jgi:plasmid stabilization system protein ParE
MDWTVEITPRASLELDEDINWYNNLKPELGTEFLTEVTSSIEKPKDNPYAFRTIFHPVRRIVLKRFPYKILFHIVDQQIVVIGVVHHRRSNRYLKSHYK